MIDYVGGAFIVPAAVDNVVFNTCLCHYGSVFLYVFLAGAVPGEVHIFVENGGETFVCRTLTGKSSAVLGHLAENVIKILSESERNAYGFVAFSGNQLLAPRAVCRVCSAHIKVIDCRGRTNLIVPRIVALNLEHYIFAVLLVVNDSLGQSLFCGPASHVAEGYFFLVLRGIREKSKLGQSLGDRLTLGVVTLNESCKFDLVGSVYRADSVKHESRHLFKHKGGV